MFEKQLEYIKSKTGFVPEIAIVLGSGLGAFEECIDKVCEISYNEIEDFPVSTAPSHKGKFVMGTLGGKNVIVMCGRVHLYEGYTPQQVIMPIRIMRLLGAEKLILTNAAGGINKGFNPGDFMIIKDHISCFAPSPLIGKNEERFGTRFPDMSNAYSKRLRSVIKETARKLNINIKEGVYTQLTGPQFESPAEIKMLGLLGSDAVGMSTVIEAIAANHIGFEVCGISLITNLACGLLDKPLSGEEVNATASLSAEIFRKLIIETVKSV